MQAVKWQKTKQKCSRNYVNFIMQKTMSESTDRWNIKVCVLVGRGLFPFIIPQVLLLFCQGKDDRASCVWGRVDVGE